MRRAYEGGRRRDARWHPLGRPRQCGCVIHRSRVCSQGEGGDPGAGLRPPATVAAEAGGYRWTAALRGMRGGGRRGGSRRDHRGARPPQPPRAEAGGCFPPVVAERTYHTPNGAHSVLKAHLRTTRPEARLPTGPVGCPQTAERFATPCSSRHERIDLGSGGGAIRTTAAAAAAAEASVTARVEGRDRRPRGGVIRVACGGAAALERRLQDGDPPCVMQTPPSDAPASSIALRQRVAVDFS